MLPVIVGGAVSAGIGYMIRTAVLWALANFFGRLIAGLGLATVTYIGLDSIVTDFTSQAMSYLSFPSEIQQFLGVLRLDQLITLWTSALTVKLTMTTLTKVIKK